MKNEIDWETIIVIGILMSPLIIGMIGAVLVEVIKSAY